MPDDKRTASATPPMRTQPAFQPFAQPPAAGPVPPAAGPASTPAGPPPLGGPVAPQAGVPFTIVCPEGYLPVVKFIKIPERAPRPEGPVGGPADPASPTC